MRKVTRKKGITFKNKEDAKEYAKFLREQGVQCTLQIPPEGSEGPIKVIREETPIEAREKERTAYEKEMEDIEKAIKRGETIPGMTLGERLEAKKTTRYGKGALLKAPPEETPARIKEEIVAPAARYAFKDIMEAPSKAKRPPDVLSGFKRAIPVSAAERQAAGKHGYKYFARIGDIGTGATKITEGALGTGGMARIASLPRTSSLPGMSPGLRLQAPIPRKTTGITSTMRFSRPTARKKGVSFAFPYMKESAEEKEEK